MFLKKENELDFSCQSCGNCCKHFNINLTHLDIERILENRSDLNTDDFVGFAPSDKDDHESFISTYGKRQIVLKKKKGKNECVFLENNMCSIHDFKPRVCKVWPFSLEENNEIKWIKEHRGFIKKQCKHISVPGENNPDELLQLLKQHYKERNLFTKISNKWNNSKKELLNSGEMFLDIYDEDFLKFILEEANIKKSSEEELNKEEDFLSKIINNLVKDRRVDAITESKVNNTYSSDRNNGDISFIIYIQENAIESFCKDNNLNILKENLNAELFVYDNRTNNLLFFIEKQFLNLQIKPFSDLKKNLNYDTKVIYNPYSLEIILKDLYSQTKEELLKNYDLFWFKILKVIKYIERENFIDAKFLLNSIVNIEFSAIIFWLNQKNFILSDIVTLNNKPKDLSEFMKKFDNNKSIKELKDSTMDLIEIFYETWKITGLGNNQIIESKVRESIENFIQ
jgi:Fe-S-cluster containining protein